MKKLFIIAMEDEAKDVIPSFIKKQEKPFLLYENDKGILVITKVGKVNASFVLSTIIANYEISEIINIGFAGANGNYQIGDVFAITSAKYHDFDATAFGYEPGQVPKLPASYSSDPRLLKKYSFDEAIIYTGDYFMTEIKEGNYLVDMEATALFQVAYLTNTPIIAIKVVSDIIGSKKHIDEYKNFEENGSKYIFNIYKKIINEGN